MFDEESVSEAESSRVREQTARFSAASVSALEPEDLHDTAAIIETTVSPFHCFYQDALEFHTQSHVRRTVSEAEASRLARAAVLLYLASAEALVHQAALELGRPEIARLICDREHPLPLADAWRMLPLAVAESHPGFADPNAAPWPQFAELLEIRASWAYPGTAQERHAYYRQSHEADGSFQPLQPHQIPGRLNLVASDLVLPRTGLPRDPYAFAPQHVDTARSVLDAAIEALDRRLGGALTRGGRHWREPIRRV